MTVRVALAQFSGHIDKNINIEKAESLARQAAGNGAKVVCFPELCTTIYFCFDRDKKWFETAEPVPGPAVDRLRRVAKETGTVIVYQLYENDGGVLYNTAVVIDPPLATSLLSSRATGGRLSGCNTLRTTWELASSPAPSLMV